MKTITSIILVIIVIFVGFLLLRSDEGAEPQENAENLPNDSYDQAPNFTLTDIDGNTVSLSDFEGKITVINAWATWCPFCVDELPDFVALQKEFGDEIVMIAINRQESLSKSRDYTDNLNTTDGMLWLLDPDDSFYKSVGGFSMPETLFVDVDNNIRIHKRGPMELEEMIDKVNSII